jgi:hypothetical protein
VPGGFGFRNLALTTVLGPRRIALSDGGVTLEVACLENEMTWTLTNHGSDPVDLHLNLASKVEAHAQGDAVTISLEGVRLQLRGINRLEGQKIIAQAPPRASTRFRFLIEKP